MSSEVDKLKDLEQRLNLANRAVEVLMDVRSNIKQAIADFSHSPGTYQALQTKEKRVNILLIRARDLQLEVTEEIIQELENHES